MNAIARRGNWFDDLFNEMASGYYVRPLHGDPLPSPGKIKLDVKDSDAAFLVHAEVPGVRKEDIHVSVDGNVVTVRAEVRQEDKSGSDEKLLRSERYYGAVARSLQLPVDVDSAKSKAKYENGVLTLTLPKKQISGGTQTLKIE